MTDTAQEDADPWTIAVHEAGHLAVASVLGRETERVSLDCIDGKRGCFYFPIEPENWNDFDEVASLLAGPRVQVELCPESIKQTSLKLFQDKIIQPMTGPRQKPAAIYDSTGWQYDIEPVYTRLTRPDWPAIGMPLSITHRRVIEIAEARLKSFSRDENIRACLIQLAKAIHRDRFLDEGAIRDLIAESNLVGISTNAGHMKWEQAPAESG